MIRRATPEDASSIFRAHIAGRLISESGLRPISSLCSRRHMADPTTAANIVVRRAHPDDAPSCVTLRGLTRENAIPASRLRELGITADTWGADIESGALPGWVAVSATAMLGYCFGAKDSGEVVVLALHPSAEGHGLGKRLLQLVVDDLRRLGHRRLFLGCSSDPRVRSYGFYRHLGWRSTGRFDPRGDEVLELAQ